MSHRVRSKTVDSADSKRGNKGAAPRRITEKIAIIKKREHEQSAEFEQAMQSIFEMQQARIHPGGGSMPSLQAIDSTPPAPSIDMQSIFRDFDKMKRGSGSTRMESNLQRGSPMARHSSMETEPYLPVNLSKSDHHYWNGSGDWLEGELARHKSDSDLQQSLMMGGQTSPQVLSSPQQQLLHRQHKMNPPVDLWSNKKRPNSATTHALLSPDHYLPSPERLTPPPMGGASVGTASSLPDLTNIEFSCGLDVPLERDESPLQEPQQYALPPLMQPFHQSPTIRMTGPSNLVYNSFQAPPNVYYSSPPNSGGVYPQPPVSGGYQQLSPLSMGNGISRSPTMPEFRNIHSTNDFVARYRPPPPGPAHYKPILPNTPLPLAARLSELLPQVRMIPGHTPSSNNAPPPMTIIIQPPPPTSQSTPVRQQSLPTTFPQHDPVVPSSYEPPLSPDKVSANQYLNGVPTQKSLSPSTTVPSSFGLCLPSYTEARLQQSLQHKFASINVGRNEGMVRSHSEENLQKVQKEKPEVIQHNPFMGTLANANSVPCVYVDPSGPENYYNEHSDSPPIDSPSTSASYASSPPSVRPYWIEEEGSLREYVFNEWPLDGGGGGGQRSGSPPAHHRSLSDLGSIIPDITDLVSSNRSHQLSLPSVAMTDLTVDEQLDKMNSPSDYYHDFEMGEAMMDSLLKSGHPFDVFPSDGSASSLGISPFIRTDLN